MRGQMQVGILRALVHGGGALTPASYGTLVAGWVAADAVLSGTDVTALPARWGTGTLSAAGAPQYSATGWAGTLPTITFDGIDDGLFSDAIGSFASGEDGPWFVVAAIDALSTATGQTYWGLGRAASANPRAHLATTTTARYQSLRRQDSGTNVNVTSAASTNVTGRVILSWEFPGTTCTLRRNGTPVSGMNGASQNAGVTTLDQWSVGMRRSASLNDQWGNFRLGALLLYSSLTDEPGARAFVRDVLGYAP